MEEIIWRIVGIAIFVLGFWGACELGFKNYKNDHKEDK